MVFGMLFQDCDAITVYSVTDWAGCLRTGKSTSGGCIVLGSHLNKVWLATQASLAPSSGEAEYFVQQFGQSWACKPSSAMLASSYHCACGPTARRPWALGLGHAETP